jgi:non-ribosomal peptide synthetase component F
MFNTGDIARWRQDGELDILGREDDQVKIKVESFFQTLWHKLT